MINHARTLLLNTAAYDNDGIGAEFISPTFHPLVLPDWMQLIHRLLFPETMTAYQRNFHALGLMQLLHHIDMLPYTLLMDPRITYSLTDNEFKRLRLGGLTVTKFFADTTTDLGVSFSGDRDPRDIPLGAGQYTWDIEHRAYDGNSVTVAQHEKRLHTVTFNAGVSSHIRLIPDYLSVYFLDTTEEMTEAFKLTIDLQVPVAFDPVKLLAAIERLDMRNNAMQGVFTPWSEYQMQLDRLRVIWHQSAEPMQRLAAFLQSYLIQCERIRQRVPFPGGSTTVRVA